MGGYTPHYEVTVEGAHGSSVGWTSASTSGTRNVLTPQTTSSGWD